MATFSHFLALINAAFVLTSTEVTKSARWGQARSEMRR